VISKLVEVTWVVNPAQFTLDAVGIEDATLPVVNGADIFFPVVDGVAGLAPEVRETLPVVRRAGAGVDAFPVVSGLAIEVVRGLDGVELNPKAGPDCSWYIV